MVERDEMRGNEWRKRRDERKRVERRRDERKEVEWRGEEMSGKD